MKLAIIIILMMFPLMDFASIPAREYVTQKIIKSVCNLGELLGCVNFRQGRILLDWRLQGNPYWANRIYRHEVGHWITRKWTRDKYIEAGYEDTNVNDIVTLSEKFARDYEINN